MIEPHAAGFWCEHYRVFMRAADRAIALTPIIQFRIIPNWNGWLAAQCVYSHNRAWTFWTWNRTIVLITHWQTIAVVYDNAAISHEWLGIVQIKAIDYSQNWWQPYRLTVCWQMTDYPRHLCLWGTLNTNEHTCAVCVTPWTIHYKSQVWINLWYKIECLVE